jgi:hypothetical protein
MINEQVTKKLDILGVLDEFYESNNADKALIDVIIDACELREGPESSFVVGEHAQLINSLMQAKQKTTANLMNMLNTVARLQANELNDEGDGMDDLRARMRADLEAGGEDEDEDDGVDDLVGQIKAEIDTVDDPEIKGKVKELLLDHKG